MSILGLSSWGLAVHQTICMNVCGYWCLLMCCSAVLSVLVLLLVLVFCCCLFSVFSHLHVPVYRDMYIAGAGAEWFWGCVCFFGAGTQQDMSALRVETVRNV